MLFTLKKHILFLYLVGLIPFLCFKINGNKIQLTTSSRTQVLFLTFDFLSSKGSDLQHPTWPIWLAARHCQAFKLQRCLWQQPSQSGVTEQRCQWPETPQCSSHCTFLNATQEKESKQAICKVKVMRFLALATLLQFPHLQSTFVLICKSVLESAPTVIQQGRGPTLLML